MDGGTDAEGSSSPHERRINWMYHPSVSDLPAHTIALIRRCNAFDIQLYQQAQEIFAELSALYAAEQTAGEL
jgi:hypothetical protein